MFFKHLGLLALILAFIAATSEAGDNAAIAFEPRNICMQVDPSMKHTEAMIDLENRLRSSGHFKEFMLLADEMTQRLKEANPDQFVKALAQADLQQAEAELGLSKTEAEQISQRLDSAANALFTEFPELINYAPKPSSLIYNPRAQAIFMERIVLSEKSIEKINLFTKLHRLNEENHSPHAKDDISFESLLFFPPGGPGLNPPEGPEPCALNPSCDPPDPPEEHETIPPDEIEGFMDGDCSMVPYLASVALCTQSGPFFLACWAVAVCGFCEGPEGGFIDTLCE